MTRHLRLVQGGKTTEPQAAQPTPKIEVDAALVWDAMDVLDRLIIATRPTRPPAPAGGCPPDGHPQPTQPITTHEGAPQS